ncbi:MAG: XRE family transcriptional regulator [Streptosporangiaceae bacterium]|nr:XRE family transcriptional regulator [Streptosporangiaceae bacterium]
MVERPPRTLLEQHIRQRCLTYEEFVQHTETFARDHHEPGTLSLRHLQRLVRGQHPGALRPATARLLEHLFGEPIATLLAPPKAATADDGENSASELRQLLDAARRVDSSTIELLHQQLDAIRRLDRKLGAIVVRDELNAKIRQVQGLATYSLAPGTREPLAALLSEMQTLAGWQALDLGDVNTSWQHYEQSRSAAAQSRSIAHEAHAAAEQAFVLIDVTATRDAVELLDYTRHRADTAAPRILRAWLAAAHGEALAAHGDQSASLHAFDQAAHLLPDDASDERPYVALDTVHLARWRGHALARFGHPDATAILTDALGRLDPTFVRAETALRVDLATAHATNGDRDEARTHADHAAQLAAQVGSARQRRRIKTLLATVR